METKSLYASVDLGGTSIKCALIDSEGELIYKWEIPTDISNHGQNITQDISTALGETLKKLDIPKDRLVGIGMGAPGFVDIETGVVAEAVNLGWKNYNLKKALEEATQLPAFVDNDANVAALGERWQGAGEGADDVLAVTLGTGIGGGIIANGKILHGISGMAGEIGHITVIPEGGYPCNCGKTGCLETVSSATGIRRLALDQLPEHPESTLHNLYEKNSDLSSKDVFDAAEAGDSYAVLIVERVTFYLGWALANLANTLNPQKIVIGGGVSLAGETLMSPLRHHMKTFSLRGAFEGLDLVLATLGNDAGIYGGAWLVKHNMEY
ncbi:ROK family glucokinase [Pullulanibacillus sp. KACC 23026]|uniref:ROK family glucokinase n=1 Tax=Pullulanibacillus sp. KACC 23026 TaxID=3028315 RepID=UPI0023AFCF37|nr:ROK family glucokinase [Pullulanibacillus sp. KACC 23026]WEG14275.1 ROK family glucokinase [Pullulanibacillus sp. KACC 23026]